MMKTLQSEKLAVKIFDTRDEMGREAAMDAAATIKDLLSKKETLNMIFAAAPSQNDMLKYLAEDRSVDFTRINAFHMDEYVGLPQGHPQSFGAYLRAHIFSLRPFRSVNYIAGYAEDPQAECRRYAQLLHDNPVDIILMGVGENGHIAFNDPSVADFNDPETVRVVKLEDRCRQQQVNDGCFASFDEVPAYAMTVTVAGLMRAAHHFCVVPTRLKAQAVRDMLYGPVGEACPGTALRSAGHATLYLDADSASLL